MKYKVIANVAGESKPRQLFAPDRLQSGQCASLILRSVPAGTEVRIYEMKEELIQTFVKQPDKADAAAAPPSAAESKSV